ncbi:MAG: flotillin family protein [Bacteroidales bacterium]|nr:flotillin family protein [Bacteroidales bacterium]
MSNLSLIIGGVVILVLLIVLLVSMYVKAPPSIAYILSGVHKEPRVLIGTGGFKIPFFERLDKVFLGQVTVDVKTNKSVPTRDFINVNVDAVTKVRVNPSAEGTRLAAKNFLNMNEQQIAEQIQDSLEGNMRECIGSLSLEAINTDRDAFSDQIQSKATPDMEKLGLEILSCNIQNVTDDNNLIRDLGADNTFSIKKNAAITKANAERDIAIAESNAKKEANDVRVKAETEIAERNNELAIKQADLKAASDTKKATADAAYEIQKQEQQKTINIKTVDAAIEKTKREQSLSEESIKVKQNRLAAEVNAEADANKYQVRVNAEAALEQQKREAEAKAYLAQQEAEAIKAKADAAKYAALQEAAGIEAKGKAEAAAKQAVLEAEAAGIKAKGLAEANAMEKKADAYEKYGQVAVIDIIAKMYESVLPDMAKSVAEPMSKIGGITIYGTNGNEAAGISGNVPVVLGQALDTVKDATGIDLKNLVDAHGKTAKTDKNIKVDGIPDPTQLAKVELPDGL